MFIATKIGGGGMEHCHMSGAKYESFAGLFINILVFDIY
jgi:hypothetical protein